MDADSGWPGTNGKRPPSSRSFRKTTPAPGGGGGERGLLGGPAPP